MEKFEIRCSTSAIMKKLCNALASAPKKTLKSFEKIGKCSYVAVTKNLKTQMELSTYLVKIMNDRYSRVTFYSL